MPLSVTSNNLKYLFKVIMGQTEVKKDNL